MTSVDGPDSIPKRQGMIYTCADNFVQSRAFYVRLRRNGRFVRTTKRAGKVSKPFSHVEGAVGEILDSAKKRNIAQICQNFSPPLYNVFITVTSPLRKKTSRPVKMSFAAPRKRQGRPEKSAQNEHLKTGRKRTPWPPRLQPLSRVVLVAGPLSSAVTGLFTMAFPSV
jgi:hypothetical protein